MRLRRGLPLLLLLLPRLSLRNRPTVRIQKRWCRRLGRGRGHRRTDRRTDRRTPSTSSVLGPRGACPYHRRSGERHAELPGCPHELLPRLRLHGRLLRQTPPWTGLLRRRLLPRRELVALLLLLLLLLLPLGLLRRLLRLKLGWQPWRASWSGRRSPPETKLRHL